MSLRSAARSWWLVWAAATVAHRASAQSLLERPPNVSGDWVVDPGTIQFDFLHRFIRSDAPERKITNFPTFVIGVGLPARLMVGLTYATNSTLAPRYPNEWEFFLRYALLSEDAGAPLDLAGQVGYNVAAEGADGEVSLARRLGRLRLLGVARVLSNPFVAGETRFALGGGATLRLTRHVALAADVASLTQQDTIGDRKPAWSVGIHVALPNTPHTLSIQATNTNTATLQGLSRGGVQRRYGFEFTIPITLARFFGHHPATPAPAPSTGATAIAPTADSAPPPAPEPSPSPAPANAPSPPAAQDSASAAPVAAPPPGAPRPTASPKARVSRAVIRSMRFAPQRIEIVVGTTVIWKNADPLAHTVTAGDGSFNSGPVESGASWRHTFTRPGTYAFACTPHPFMTGVIVVREDR